MEDAELLRSISPIHRFDKLRAPILFVHGEHDSNVPVEESDRAVKRARELGIHVDYLRFEGEGHELALARNREKFVHASVSWLQQTLGLI